MSDDILGRFKSPELRARLAPISGHVAATARSLGVDPAFVMATIASESSGVPTAVGDNGQSHGLYQVQTRYMKDYGFDPKNDTRKDPMHATTAIMPSFRRLLDKAGGNWGAARAGYMRGPKVMSQLVKGAVPEDILDPIALREYRKFVAAQSGFATPAPTPRAPPPLQVPDMTSHTLGMTAALPEYLQNYAEPALSEPPVPYAGIYVAAPDPFAQSQEYYDNQG